VSDETSTPDTPATEAAPYVPEHLERWTLPRYYVGAEWPEYFTFLGRSRDSDTVEESNFQASLAALGGETETVLVIRESHWAVGWVEWIGIHESDAAALRVADEIAAGLKDYPVVDEDHLGNLELERACEAWAGMSVRERVDFLKRHGGNVSRFAARRDELPQDLPELSYLYG
jgi:hypothetical protein